jgi:hypothetical protein
MARKDERGTGELLAAVLSNVVAVPVVLGFVALGVEVLVSRSLLKALPAVGTPRTRQRRSPRKSGGPTIVPPR